MKKILLISVALFTRLSMNAQVEKLIYEMDWAGVEYTEGNYFVGEAPNASYYKATDEGLAITNPAINDHIWEVRVINRSSEDHGLSLEEGHDYIVRLTLKVPSDGHIFMQLGNLDSSWYDGASVTASDDWQMIDIESPSYYCDISDGAHVLLGFGEMVGTTILKKVQVYERTTPKYFPTGMTWEEVVVTPDMGQEYYNAHIYEISTDTIIGNVTYKKVLKDNVFSGLCVRESGDKVWLLTKDYPTEILLYNFDWDSNQEVVTEYLKGQEVIGFIGQNEEAYEVRQETTPVGDSQTVVIDGKTYQYYRDSFIRSQIRGIGKVAELNRYPCLLSYREPAVILPGLDYHKVHWIKRNGVEIFRSESAKEWTAGIMDDFRPFVEEDKVWKVGTIPYDLDIPVQIVDYYYFDGDTIIDGKTCKMMMCQHFTSPNYPYYEYLSQPNSLRYVGAWYEENQKVYFYDERTQSMVMKYDFSLGANETVSLLGDYLPFIIGPKQTGGLDGFKGVYRDVMIWLNEDQIANNTIWLEGVGGIDGPTKNAYYIDTLADRVPEFLMACVVGDEVIFLNDKYEDEATPAGARKNRFDFTHTNKLKPKSRVRSEEEPSLYGEYNDHQLDINLDPLDDAYQVSITDGSGKAVYEKVINAGNIVALNIDISDYAKDHYTVTVENSRESFTGEFETLTNGIEENVKIKKLENVSIYNLQGQRLSRLQKGLNIVNGKKIYVKN